MECVTAANGSCIDDLASYSMAVKHNMQILMQNICTLGWSTDFLKGIETAHQVLSVEVDDYRLEV